MYYISNFGRFLQGGHHPLRKGLFVMQVRHVCVCMDVHTICVKMEIVLSH